MVCGEKLRRCGKNGEGLGKIKKSVYAVSTWGVIIDSRRRNYDASLKYLAGNKVAVVCRCLENEHEECLGHKKNIR